MYTVVPVKVLRVNAKIAKNARNAKNLKNDKNAYELDQKKMYALFCSTDCFQQFAP